ncbi:L,D-transpeptidase family protein [Photobacterium sp.]|uniref:L,D-transpeptidase family protein n=1 Tax=Photobacterium sp. TaxID=660 RepID=UPI00299EEE9D|nr:L,D-transpeptidase family protein [Photobacterium sp.]MDX1304603.1 L,D-transpeptidase family protein [Photobacterium sp.]
MFDHKRVFLQWYGQFLVLFFLLLSGGTSAGENFLSWSYLDNVAVNSSRKLCPSTGSKVCFAQLSENAYAANNFYPFWQQKALRKELELQLKSVADTEMVPGLSERLSELRTLALRTDQRAYDLLATDSYYVYQVYLAQIKRDRSTLFKTEPLTISNESNVMLSQHMLPLTLTKLQSSRPQNTKFEQAMVIVEKMQKLPSHSLSSFRLQREIHQGGIITAGQGVIRVLYDQGDLNQSDFERLSQSESINNSGVVFDSIKRFQRRHGLVVDGIIGLETAMRLTMPYDEIARRIALNLQRSRVTNYVDNIPHIWVNIPDYMLRIFNGNEVVFESKVIVGRSTRPTNLFSSSINTMVINPSWNVPVTIKRKDIVPNVKRSRDYLVKHNMQILKSWRDRTEIPVDQIDWQSVNPKTFPYEFQQGPGPNNALGKVKFLMPNDYSIFLHDTPTRGLFGKTKRNFSSGCVRVEKAEDLANFIIDFQRRSNIAPYSAMVNNNNSDTVYLSKRLGVDFIYLTAWIDEHNALQMREDIYGYDSPRAEPVESQYISMKNFRR